MIVIFKRLTLLFFLAGTSAVFAQENESTTNSGEVVQEELVEVKGEITDILYSQLPGGKVQVDLLTTENVAEPSTFYTNNPARLALDFFKVGKSLDKNVFDVKIGKLDSVVAVETDTRTRVIFNLDSVSEYEVIKSDNGYTVFISNSDVSQTGNAQPKPFSSQSDLFATTNVENIDFRRSPEGGGNLIVTLDNDNVVVDTRDKDGEIIVDILGANLPKEFERRLDVIDFATPVQSVDAFQNGEDVRLVLVPSGQFQHVSLHSGDKFNLTVNPIIETEADKKRKRDEASGYTGERLSLNFQKIEVRAALAVIADFTGINFVTSDSVQGEITLNLKDVPWDQALEVIMRSEGLSKRESGNVFWIAPTEEIAKAEEAELQASATAAELQPLTSELIQINYAKAEEIAKVIKSVRVIRQGSVGSRSNLGSDLRNALNVTETDKNSLLSDRGSVTVDKRTNSILVRDIASQIKGLRDMVAKLDKPVRQVMIETRIVEASDTFSRELGSRFGFQRVVQNAKLFGSGSNIGEVISGGTTEGNQVIRDSQLDDEPGLIFDRSRNTPGGLAVDLGANGIDGNLPASYAFDIFRAGNGFNHLITLELSALEADGRGKIIASPRLITANQQEAYIKQGEERVFTVRDDEDVEVETKEAVLSLTVTPQITPDDRVILDVSITQDNFIPNADPQVAAALRKKEITTQVLADNGETIVIGGIYQEENTKGVTKVPILGDIPYLGNLFKKTTKRDNRTELLIFLTPKVISPKLSLD